MTITLSNLCVVFVMAITFSKLCVVFVLAITLSNLCVVFVMAMFLWYCLNKLIYGSSQDTVNHLILACSLFRNFIVVIKICNV